MRTKIARTASILLVTTAALLAVGLACTWQHWWWPAPHVRVAIDGKPTHLVRVFHGSDGRYLLVHANPSRDWYMQPVVVPGYQSAADTVWVHRAGDRGSLLGSVIVLPFAAFATTLPIQSTMLSYHELDPNVQRFHGGFAFTNRMDNAHWPGRGRTARYRVEL